MPYKNKDDANRRRRERNAAKPPDQRKAEYEKRADYFSNWAKAHRSERQARENERYATDPEFRAKRCAEKAVNRDRPKEYSRELRRQYGITTEDVERMKLEQGGKCASCGDVTEKLHVDHCHKTNMVRALLCAPCNKALGLLKDNADRAEAAAAYLRKHNPEAVSAPLNAPETKVQGLIYQHYAMRNAIEYTACDYCGKALESLNSRSRYCSNRCKCLGYYYRHK